MFNHFANVSELLQQEQPQQPVNMFHQAILEERIGQFQRGFAGLLTYAVKANPEPMLLQTMLAQGITSFDVASLEEIELIDRLGWQAGKRVTMHFNNPIKPEEAIARAWHQHGIRSFSLDDEWELEKLIRQIDDPATTELAVRFVAPQKHSVMLDLNSKFGACVDAAVALLAKVAKAGFKPSLTFHPGTQCTDPNAYEDYIACAAQIAERAGVAIYRLNVGGGFPSNYLHSNGPDLTTYFATIDAAVKQHFREPPYLVCEPGRALVNDCVSLLVKVIHRRTNNVLFLNDGIYGSFSEMNCANLGWPLLFWPSSCQFKQPSCYKTNSLQSFTAYGPTCDSIDVLPFALQLPADIATGDYIEIPLMGAYAASVATRFNGFIVDRYALVDRSSYFDTNYENAVGHY